MTRRRLGILALQAVIVALVVGAFGTVGFLEYSAQPGFCNNCHNMEPYYESWLQSSHNTVPCIKCHYAPGIKAEAMGKIQAANQVVKYITRTYGEKPWAEIEDAACTREGCHLPPSLGGVLFKGIRFDHQEHLGELRRGKQLRCTSCHSQIVQGEHLTVTESTCFLCHFKDRPEGQPLGGCLGCHPSPPNVEYEGVSVDHAQVVRDMVSCSKCHSDVTVGDGAVPEQQCWSCHNVPERVAQIGNPELLHRTHIAEHNVECQQCHTEIEHRVAELTESMRLECSNCHRGAHEAQRQLFTGSGGKGVEETPSRMFLARVTCESCHMLPGELPGHEGVSLAGEATCLSCHGVRFANILPAWEKEMAERVEKVGAALRRVRRGVGRRGGEEVDSLLRAAEENLELVRVGKGAHNVPYADRLLRAALEMAQTAARRAGLDASVAAVNLGRPLEEGSCQTCHFGVETRDPLRWKGRVFYHERHVVNAGMECTACHTPLSEHGGLRITSPATCDGCHHLPRSAEACFLCHESGPADTLAVPAGSFVHAPHVEGGLSCDFCHEPPSMSAQGADCASCHVIHHEPERNCLLCHGPETQSRHPGAVIHTIPCTSCHTKSEQKPLVRWSRTVCLVCHQDRVEHNAPVECVQCHQIPPMGGGGGEEAGPG